eukprot:gene34941-17395_t
MAATPWNRDAWTIYFMGDDCHERRPMKLTKNRNDSTFINDYNSRANKDNCNAAGYSLKCEFFGARTCGIIGDHLYDKFGIRQKTHPMIHTNANGYVVQFMNADKDIEKKLRRAAEANNDSRFKLFPPNTLHAVELTSTPESDPKEVLTSCVRRPAKGLSLAFCQTLKKGSMRMKIVFLSRSERAAEIVGKACDGRPVASWDAFTGPRYAHRTTSAPKQKAKSLDMFGDARDDKAQRRAARRAEKCRDARARDKLRAKYAAREKKPAGSGSDPESGSGDDSSDLKPAAKKPGKKKPADSDSGDESGSDDTSSDPKPAAKKPGSWFHGRCLRIKLAAIRYNLLTDH